MKQYNPCYGCDRRTAYCHSACSDYAALQADNALRREYLVKHRKNAADAVLNKGKAKRIAMRTKLVRR